MRRTLVGLLGVLLLGVLALGLRALLATEERGGHVAPGRRVAPVLPADAAELELGLRGGSAEGDRVEARTRLDDPDAAPDLARSESEALALIHGEVVGPERAPLAAIEVFAFEARGQAERTLLASAETDEEGAYALADLDREVLLVFQGDGWVPLSRRARPDEFDTHELRAAAPLDGLVLDARTRAPLADVEVRLDVRHFDGERLHDALRTRSAADGSWSLPFAPVGMRTRLTALRAGTAPALREVQVRPDAEAPCIVLLADAAPLLIAFRDAESQAPVADVSIELGGGIRVLTDARGEAQLTLDLEQAKKPLEFDARAEGYARTVGELSQEDRTDGRVTILLHRGAEVSGSVIDAQGSPIAEARVRLIARRSRALSGETRSSLRDATGLVRTNASGQFRLHGLAPRDEPARVEVWHEDFAPKRSVAFDLSTSDSRPTVRVRLSAGARLTGRVMLDGAPFATRLAWEGGGLRGEGRSNDSGRFALEGLPADSIRLRPAEGSQSLREQSLTVALAEGDNGDVEFPLVAGGEPIGGRVTLMDGRPLGGLRVLVRELEARRAPNLRVETDSDGGFRLLVDGAPEARYRVDVDYGAERVTLVDIAAGTLDLDVRFEEQGALLLEVRDAQTGERIDDLEVHWRRVVEDTRWRRFPGGRGALVHGAGEQLELALPLGRVDLLVGAPARGYPPVLLPGVGVVRSPRRAERVLLEAGTQLTLTFVDEAGEPARPPGSNRRGGWSLVRVLETEDPARELPRWTRQYPLRIGGDGRVVLEGLTPGSYRVDPARQARRATITPRRIDVAPVGRQARRIEVGPPSDR